MEQFCSANGLLKNTIQVQNEKFKKSYVRTACTEKEWMTAAEGGSRSPRIVHGE
jgi:hypothetical protein